MPSSYIETNFSEKSGIIPCITPWGKWWQTVNEIHIEVNVKEGTRSKDIKINVKPSLISVCIFNKILFEGILYSVVQESETIWTLEDRKKLYIVIVKAESVARDTLWAGLLQDEFMADPLTLHEMRKKIDLENFQMENPGFDFSNAQLSKCYDKLPGKT